MAQDNNALSKVLIGFESAYGVSPTAAAAIQLPFFTCTVAENQPPQESGLLGSGNRNPSKPWRGNRIVSGELTGPLDLIAIGYILKTVFGAPTTTGSGSPYTHTYKIGTTTPSFLLEKGFIVNSLFYLYNGCKANGINIKVGKGNQLIYSIPIIGAFETKSGSTYDGSPTDVSIPAAELQLSDISAVNEGGSGDTTIEELEFNFLNKPEIGYALASAGKGSDSSEGKTSITGRIGGLFSSDAILLKGRGATESSLTITLTRGTSSLQLLVNELEYGTNSPSIDGPGGTKFSIPYSGFYNNHAAASAFEAILINTQASYA